MMQDLIKLDDLLREFWEGFFQDFPFRDLLVLLVGTAIITLIMLII